MAPKYPSIPEPTLKPESLRDSILSIKQLLEVLTGQRGNPDYRAVLLPELNALQEQFTLHLTDFDWLAHNAAVRYDVAQSLSDGQIEVGQYNLRLGRARDISTQDLDNIQSPGLYNGSNLGHSPDGTTNWFYIEVWQHSNYVAVTNDWMIQRATHLTDASSTACYVRLNVGGGAWGAWKRYTLV